MIILKNEFLEKKINSLELEQPKTFSNLAVITPGFISSCHLALMPLALSLTIHKDEGLSFDL